MNSDFHIRAMEWVRTKENLLTVALPDDVVEENDGIEHLEAFVVRGSAAGGWLLAGLWAMLGGTMLVMLNLPGFTPAIRAVSERSGWITLALGVAFFVLAEVARRRQRVPTLLELRTQAAGPVTLASLEVFQAKAGKAKQWIVAEAGIAPEALATVHKRGIRCFVPDGERFRQVEPEPAARPEPSASASMATISAASA